MAIPDPKFTDGRSALLSPVVRCLNLAGDGTTYQEYEYLSDSITPEGVSVEHADADGSPLGSDVRRGFEKGSISIKCTQITHKLPAPGHVLECDFGSGSEYYVVNAPGSARTRNNVKVGSFAVTRIYNPFPIECLSEAYGQRAVKTQAAGALSGSFTSTLNVRPTRSGGALVFTLAAAPGYTVPAWLSINASTGALSGTAVAGTWELHIVVTETLAGEETRKGFGILSLVIT